MEGAVGEAASGDLSLCKVVLITFQLYYSN